MNVRVHWNLHKRVWSITHRGRVILHTPTYKLTDCSFVVQEGARQRVLRERTRAVHAYVKGTATEEESPGDLVRVRYNPYRAEYFHTDDGAPIHSARFVLFNERGEAWAKL
jgi:hypothetical protein